MGSQFLIGTPNSTINDSYCAGDTVPPRLTFQAHQVSGSTFCLQLWGQNLPFRIMKRLYALSLKGSIIVSFKDSTAIVVSADAT